MHIPKNNSCSRSPKFIWRKKLGALCLFILLGGVNSVSFAQIESFITAHDGVEGDQFGHEVAICGDYLVSGAPYNDNENGVDAGAAYIYKYENSQWILQTKLLASDGSEDELFGYSVDIDGDYLIVGCPWDDDAGEKSGAAYIYKLEEGAWIEHAKLRAADASEDDRFGIGVQIYAETVAVGAFFDDVVDNRSGSAYIFVREESTWLQQAKLTPSDGAADDWFGVVLSLHNNDVAVVSRRHDELGSNSGAVYVYNRSGSGWSEQAKITAYDGEAGDEFGTPCIFGNTLVIGSYLDDDKGRNAGAIYYYQREGGVWNLIYKYTASDGNSDDYFGSNIDLTATHLVVSAYRDDLSGENSGSVYLYEREGYSYQELGKITASNAANGDYFGLKVSMDGNLIAIGARNQDDNGDNAGAAYVFNLQENPHILSVKDVLHDQGGYVEIKWSASFYDFGRNLSYYSIWRSLEDPSLLLSNTANMQWHTLHKGESQTWGWIANVPGHRHEEYVYAAPTSCDSMAGTDGMHYFMVSAHQKNEDIFFDSNIAAGYSVDNLAPPPPTGLIAATQGNQVMLKWDISPVTDFSHFLLYRNQVELISVIENSFVDANTQENQTYNYQLRAVDVHGNASDLSAQVTVTTADVAQNKSSQPKTYQLFQNHPNPFNPETVIQFSVPKASRVLLKIYNMRGQEIKTLIDAEYPGGSHQANWDGTDNFGHSMANGIYIYVFQAGDFAARQKMSLVK
ncbi:T9SS C-terminal target domain-containing protein [candidate division KSB1 bacterium]|nr:T9SS type A sorting domain-containing protein [candidate division KSB1 bacterium]RQW05191.1 MAG: T9SS C-terminal target domain-containing protein [candidate division KSB1 bacterium]